MVATNASLRHVAKLIGRIVPSIITRRVSRISHRIIIWFSISNLCARTSEAALTAAHAHADKPVLHPTRAKLSLPDSSTLPRFLPSSSIMADGTCIAVVSRGRERWFARELPHQAFPECQFRCPTGPPVWLCEPLRS